MGKYKRGLVSEIRKDLAREKKQEQLHKKYHVNEDTLIVEKSNLMKFLICSIAGVVRIAALVLLLFLAAVGLMAILYPDTRTGLYEIYQQMIDQLQSFLY